VTIVKEITWAVFDSFPEPVLVLDGDRKIIFANDPALNLLGQTIQGEDISMALRQPAFLALAEAALAGRNPDPDEIKVSKGTPQFFEVRAAPLLGNSIAKALISMREITLLKQAEGIRSTFVANVSHELRSPLASLVGFIETLRGAAKDDPEAQEKFLSIMQNEASRMTRLIEDLLSLSSVEVDEHIPPNDPIPLIPLLSRIISVVQSLSNARMSCDFPSAAIKVVGDEDQLTQVFQNLLDNAVKYGKLNSEIKIQVSLDRDLGEGAASQVSISITDQGDGIPAKYLSRLTQRFYRVDKARSRELGGTGLGLAIVKHIVGRHRGHLEIESEEGVGSKFTVFLPLHNS